MIKLKKSEAKMSLSSIKRFFLFAAVTIGAAVGLSQKPASAIAEATIEGEASYEIVQYLYDKENETVTGDWTYKIEEISSTGITNIPSYGFSLVDEPFVEGKITKTGTIDFSGLHVAGALGIHTLKISIDSCPEEFACDNDYYTLSVLLENVVDENNFATGEYRASISNLQKNGKGAKLNKMTFACTNPTERSYITVKNTVEGDDASDKDVFKYIFQIEGEGYTYTIRTPSGEYKFGGQEVTSDEYAEGGKKAIFYLRHGETATIGIDENGDYEIPYGLEYSYEEIPDVKDYKTWIDSKDAGYRTEITKTVNEEPEDNFTLFINYRSIPKDPIDEIVDIVNTGLNYKNGLYVWLALISIGAIVTIIMIRSKKVKKKKD